jgi:hypothetical protein|tara:strand:- start:484 stop:1098 length:615 start_codon:yes stop_codon:yes gene_type:complete
MTQSKFTIRLEKEYGSKLKDKSKKTLSEYFKIPMKLLDEVYDRGLAAARSTGTRPSVKSDDQWARSRMTKFILNVVDGRKGKKTNRGAGEDGDVVDEALGRVMTLKKNRNGDAKYIAKIGNKTFKFGHKSYRDYTLMNNKKSQFYEELPAERDRVRANYRRRHKGDKLNEISSGSLSYFLLWNKPTLKESIKDFEKKFNIEIKI